MSDRFIYLPNTDKHFNKWALGGYQRAHFDIALALLLSQPKLVAIDVGAHVGHYTYNMLRRFRTVHAFEPQRDNFNCLVANTREVARRLKRKLYYHQLVAGATSASVQVELSSDTAGNSGAWEVRLLDVPADRQTVLAIDDLGLTRLDYLKIDAQGTEQAVLEGAAATLACCDPVIQVELINRGVKNYASHEWLNQHGYVREATYLKDAYYRRARL